MKRILFCILSFSSLMSCKKEAPKPAGKEIIHFSQVKVDTILAESISIRAILIDSGKVWYAGSNGKYGYCDLSSPKVFSGHVAKDTLLPEFRSIAKTAGHIFIAAIGNPGLVYRISKNGRKITLVYRENDEKVFYDSMQFYNDKEGIAMGDPTQSCLSVITTKDGGATWQKFPCEKLPKITDGEAAFAASNTNLVIKGNDTWMVSGGKKARVFYSPDKGNSWEVYDTPIVQGKAMTGIFTADFYDRNNGFIAGGDYEKPDQDSGNKAISGDGGKTWNMVSENAGFGYASCVQYFPNSSKELVCVGASGLQYSSDGGHLWKQFFKDKSLFTIRFQDDSTAIAAGKDKIVRIRFVR